MKDGTTNNGKYNICNWFYDSTSPYTVTTLYNEEYGAIEATNIAIKNLNMMPETTKRNSLLGEALALRAFAYLNLISIYGDVPANWQPLEDMDPDDESTFYPKRTSRDVIYDRIVSDLQTAANYMPWFEESGFATTERLTKQSTLALLARVALYAGGYSLRWNLETNDPATLKVSRRSDEARVRELYQIADKACSDIIEHGQNSLVQAEGGMSGFQNLWYNYCQRKFTSLNKEILWSLAQYGATTNSKFGLYAHPGTRGGTYGSRKAMQFILPTYYLSFEEGDARRDVTCTSYSIYFLEGGASNDTWVDVGTTYSCIMSGKFRIPWCVAPESDANKRNVNIPIIRYSDVLLMYAEAQCKSTGTPNQLAYKCLDRVRYRAAKNKATHHAYTLEDDGFTPEQFLQKVFDEYGYEFFAEFKRWFYLVRNEKVYEVNHGYIDAFGVERPANDRVKEAMDAARITPDNRKLYHFVLPARETQECGFEQNDRAW